MQCITTKSVTIKMFIFVIATELQKISFKKDFLDIAFSLRKIHYTYT